MGAIILTTLHDPSPDPVDIPPSDALREEMRKYGVELPKLMSNGDFEVVEQFLASPELTRFFLIRRGVEALGHDALVYYHKVEGE